MCLLLFSADAPDSKNNNKNKNNKTLAALNLVFHSTQGQFN